jgi:hypothetical protein
MEKVSHGQHAGGLRSAGRTRQNPGMDIMMFKTGYSGVIFFSINIARAATRLAIKPANSNDVRERNS